MQFSRRMCAEDHSIHPVILGLVVAQSGSGWRSDDSKEFYNFLEPFLNYTVALAIPIYRSKLYLFLNWLKGRKPKGSKKDSSLTRRARKALV
jgi:hypothetical protein